MIRHSDWAIDACCFLIGQDVMKNPKASFMVSHKDWKVRGIETLAGGRIDSLVLTGAKGGDYVISACAYADSGYVRGLGVRVMSEPGGLGDEIVTGLV
jgi:hypothetical protein